MRVLSYWRDRVEGALALVETRAADRDPRVRLEAVRAASFFTGTDAVDAALEVLNHPQDIYLEYTLRETMNQLDQYQMNNQESVGNQEIYYQSGVELAADLPTLDWADFLQITLGEVVGEWEIK